VRVLVCGGRDYEDTEKVNRTLDQLSPSPTLVIVGNPQGAEALALYWAFDKPVPVVVMYAAWEALGRSAGPIRNQNMIDLLKPDLVLAFPGGEGTADCVARARKAGIEVREIT
jgi:hypothetical protein